MVSDAGGLVLYLRREGRGIGLYAKVAPSDGYHRPPGPSGVPRLLAQ